MNHITFGLATHDALDAIYRDLDRDIALAAPVCALSGRCCRFREYDHTLFLSAIEAERLVSLAPPPSRPLDDGATCPWQDARGRCTARDARPLGCRIYFCDPAYSHDAPRLSEIYIARLKRLADSAKASWNYAPLHVHLRAALDAGRIAFPTTTLTPPNAASTVPNP